MTKAPYRIKRYANRKLYDLTAKKYVNLKQIVALIQAGNSLKITEAMSAKEITAYVLAEAIAAHQKQDNSQAVAAHLMQVVMLLPEA